MAVEIGARRFVEAPHFHTRRAWVPEDLAHRLRQYKPRTELGRIIRDCFGHLPPEMAGELLEAITRVVVIESSLTVKVIRADGSVEDWGVVSNKVITDAGVGYLVDSWQNTLELEETRYHGAGSGTTAEAAGDTDLVTPFTTQINPDNTRATGTLTEGASANIFQTVGTLTYDASVTQEEHGLFSNATVGSGVLWDRSLTGGQALNSGDSSQFTYDMTASSGG